MKLLIPTCAFCVLLTVIHSAEPPVSTTPTTAFIPIPNTTLLPYAGNTNLLVEGFYSVTTTQYTWIQFHFIADTNERTYYVFEWSTNKTQWYTTHQMRIGNRTNTEGVFEEPYVTNGPARYYRLHKMKM